jgi:hypothetical protein
MMSTNNSAMIVEIIYLAETALSLAGSRPLSSSWMERKS